LTETSLQDYSGKYKVKTSLHRFATAADTSMTKETKDRKKIISVENSALREHCRCWLIPRN